jgi:hypothetical protein
METKNILIVEYITARVLFFIERFGRHNLDIIENSSDAIMYMTEKIYDYIFLDGNLGKDDTGYKVAKFLAEEDDNSNNDAVIVIHSWNVSEVELMVKLLPQANYLPFNEAAFSSTFNI